MTLFLLIYPRHQGLLHDPSPRTFFTTGELIDLFGEVKGNMRGKNSCLHLK